ncbi:MAG: ABC transporter ATP-binding protein [Candidatus Micrarchaeota archaeon]
MIKLVDVSKIYKRGRVKVAAIDGISLEIKDGDFAVIIGASGSGKSTLMSLIGCLDVPTSGEVFIGGIKTSRAANGLLSSIRNQKIGFIFQQFNLLPTLTALDNVALPIEINGKSYSDAVQQASLRLNEVGLSDRKTHYPGELSGGQMQRVAVARALANDPEIILADEPTGNLDSKSGEEVIKLLTSLNKRGKTIILITHDLRFVKLGNRHFILKDGKLVKKVEK